MKTEVQTQNYMAKPGEFLPDPETGSDLIVTEDGIKELLSLETSINFALAQLSMSLKRVKESRLYLLRGVDSFKAYVENYISFSYRHATRLVAIADTFGDSEHFEKIATLPVTWLREAAKDKSLAESLKQGELTDSEGNVYTLDEITQLKGQELTEELKRITLQKKDLQKELKAAREQLDETRKTIEHYESSEGEKFFERIKTAKDAMGIIDYTRGVISQATHDLSRIETDDPDILRELSGLVSGAIVALSAIQDSYLPALMAAGEQGA